MRTFSESGIRQRKERDGLRLSAAVGENSYAKKTYSRFSPGKYGCIVISRFPVSAGWGGLKGGGFHLGTTRLLEGKGAVLTATYILLRD